MPPVAVGPVANWHDFVIQLVIVTAGVLIALLLLGRLLIEAQLAKKLSETYKSTIQEVFE